MSHDLAAIRPNIEMAADHVNMRCGTPFGAGMRAVRIAKRHMHAWQFLILEYVADNIPQTDISADSEFAHTITVGVAMGVFPELAFKRFVRRMHFHQPVLCNMNGYGVFSRSPNFQHK